MNWLQIIVIYLCIGTAMVEWWMYKLKRIREAAAAEEESLRERSFPGIKRLDLKNFTRFKLYPCGVIILPIRFFLAVIIWLIWVQAVWLCTIGYDFSKGPLRQSRRKKCLNFINSTFSETWAAFLCMRFKRRNHLDVSYEDYLGTSSENNKSVVGARTTRSVESPRLDDKNTSTIVSNH